MYMADLQKSKSERDVRRCRSVQSVPKADPEWQDYLDHSQSCTKDWRLNRKKLTSKMALDNIEVDESLGWGHGNGTLTVRRQPGGSGLTYECLKRRRLTTGRNTLP